LITVAAGDFANLNCTEISITWINHEKHYSTFPTKLKNEQNLKNFEQLALQFYYDTEPDGFDALYELSEKYGPDSDKGKIVREILRRQESEPDSIDF
jgi:hypothetical protein